MMDWEALISPAVAFLGIGVGWGLKSRELKRTDLRRFDEARRDLYTRALRALDAAAHQSRRLASLNAISHPTPEEKRWSSDASNRLDVALGEFAYVHSEVALLGTVEVVGALDDMEASLYRFPAVWSDDDAEDLQRVRDANTAVANARASFLRATRGELGVS